GSQSYLAGMFQNLRPGAPQYCITTTGCSYGDVLPPTTLLPNSQDLSNQAVGGDTGTRGETLNLTWQTTPKDKVTFFSHFNQRLLDRNHSNATTPPRARRHFTH